MGWVLRCLGFVLLCCGLAPPASARWLEAETPNFRVYSDGSESQLRDMAATLEDYDRLLRLLTGLKEPPAANKFEVYLVGGIGDLRIVSPKVSSDVRGFYSATPGQIAAFAIRHGEIGLDAEDVLLHEYAHHFMMQYYPTSYPTWYVEGFAEYMMTARFLPKTIEFGRVNLGRASWLVRGTWLPAQTVLEADPAKLNMTQRSMFYAESWLMVHFFFRTERGEALRQFIDARTAGQDPQAAFVKAFGMDYKQFDVALRRYRDGTISYSRLGRAVDADAPQIAVHALPATADDLLLARAAIRRGLGKQAGTALLGTIGKVAAAHPDDGLAQAVLAEAEVAFGDGARGTALLDALIARGPPDVDLLYWRGRAALRAARQDEGRREALSKEARTYFARAFRLDPDHVPTLLAYVSTEPQRPPSDNAMNILLKAHELAPQVRTISMRAAAGLMQQQRYDAAIVLLRPILTDPHAGAQAEAARRMMEVAQKHEKPAPLPADGEEDADDEGGERQPGG